MSKRSTHVNKSPSERSAYQKYIARVEPQPTIDEKKSVNFDASMDSGEELSEPTSKRKRKISFGVSVNNYLNKNWLRWFFGGIFIIGAYFMVDAKIDIAVANAKLIDQQRQINGLDSEIKSNSLEYQQQLEKNKNSIEVNKEIDHDQDLIINELRTRIEFIEKILQDIQSELNSLGN